MSLLQSIGSTQNSQSNENKPLIELIKENTNSVTITYPEGYDQMINNIIPLTPDYFFESEENEEKVHT